MSCGCINIIYVGSGVLCLGGWVECILVHIYILIYICMHIYIVFMYIIVIRQIWHNVTCVILDMFRVTWFLFIYYMVTEFRSV